MEKTIERKFQFENEDQWRQAMQFEPNPTWIMERDLGGGKTSKYVPLPIQQALADKFFRQIDVVEEHYSLVINEILCTIKYLVLPDYPDSEHRTFTGTASKPVQQDKGSSASSFPGGKKLNGLEYNAPAARSAAMSNALTSFANIFGRNLGRKVKNNFSFIILKEEKEDGDSSKQQ